MKILSQVRMKEISKFGGQQMAFVKVSLVISIKTMKKLKNLSKIRKELNIKINKIIKTDQKNKIKKSNHLLMVAMESVF